MYGDIQQTAFIHGDSTVKPDRWNSAPVEHNAYPPSTGLNTEAETSVVPRKSSFRSNLLYNPALHKDAYTIIRMAIFVVANFVA